MTKKNLLRGCELNNSDLYFKVTNSSEQKAYGAIDFEQVLDFDEPEIIKKKRNKDAMFYNKMARIQRKELRMRLAEVV